MRSWRAEIQPERVMRLPRLEGAVGGCELCGIAEDAHPAEVHGLGHFSTTEVMPLGFVPPPAWLVADRQGMRMAAGLPIAEVDDAGRARTHLVRARCRCGADAVCTPERVEGARCGECVREDAEAAVMRPGYEMTEANREGN